MKTSKIAIETDGTITMIYDDEIADLIALGNGTITRVSNVEPTNAWPYGWTVTMTNPAEPFPLPGVFRLRTAALAAEVAYLESKLF